MQTSMPRRRVRGFTLLEIMIVVAIIGILAALAIPTFNHYRLRAKSTEYRTVMSSIRAGQESFLAEMDGYASIPMWPPAPWGAFRRNWNTGIAPCNPNCNRNNLPLCTSFNCIKFTPASTVFYSYASPSAPPPTPEFSIGVIGDVDGDGVLATYTFQSANGAAAGGVGSVPDTVSTCVGQGVGYPAYQIYECTPGAY